MTSRAAGLQQLRRELEDRFGGAILPVRAPLRERSSGFLTGIAALDRLLPGGVPRGALSLWTGEATSGRTAALRALVQRACAEGATVTVIDAGLTLDPGFASTPAGGLAGLWAVRPPQAEPAAGGAWAAEVLLRAGVFDLVVLDGCVPEAAQAHRLRALARERDAAVVISTPLPHPSGYPLSAISYQSSTPPHSRFTLHDSRFSRPSSLPFRADVRLEFRRAEGVQEWGLMPGGRFRRRVRLALRKQGAGTPAAGERELEVVHEAADRLCTHWPAPDRSPGGR